MNNQIRKAISLVLVLVQLFVLLPVLQPQAKAAQSEPETPVLNETVVGTVKFQSFNFLGDNEAGSDGVDYSATFYYTDDYFSPSAINTKAAGKTADWDDLSANELSLASCSIDFAVASMTSAHGDVLRATSRTWENSDYSDKDKNIKAFLSDCGFTNIEPSATMLVRPTNDSIAYTIASKPITVWDETSGTNKRFTLVAVGVRGAGYGQEWASNVTIGTPGQGASVVRHKGFDDGAQTVCAAVRDYLSRHGITRDVKYWVTGFSRAAAVANLAAGYLSDSPGDYHTSERTNAGNPDVYAFTWESPQAASTAENALRYRNIHNIINAMDAVPKVSPDSFNHQRLGIDYRMPYYGNTTEQGNEAYYTGMREVLKTIAVGAYNYGGQSYQEDPLISATDPANYPYNRTMRVRTITPTQLIGDAIDGTLMENFGTVDAAGSDRKITPKHIDEFVDDLIQVFLVSKAWVGQMGDGRTPIQNRTTFINDYQNDFRNVLGYLLDYSGPAFMVLIEKVVDAVGDQLSATHLLENGGLALAFTNFYASPNNTYRLVWQSGWEFWIGDVINWTGKTRRQVLINEAQPVVRSVMRSMVGNSFSDPQGISRSMFENSLDKLVALVVNLYADELTRYNSNYFGTTLFYMWEILSAHEQETVMSWIKSLDPNHMNRSCRTITIPAGCDATVYEYRPQYAQYEGSMDDAEAKAPPVAELENGTLNSKDGRITLYQENGGYVIRYPASLQIRVDVKPNQTIHLNSIAVDDYETRYAYTAVSDGQSQFQNKPLYNTYTTITQQPGKTNAAAKNTALSGYGTIGKGDTLHVIVNDMQAFNSGDTVYELLVDKAPQTTVVDYGAPSAGLAAGSDADGAVRLGIDTTVSSSTDASLSIPTRKTQITVPASSVYFDDELTTGSAADYTGETTRMDWNDETQESVGKLFWYQFRGTRIDLYCTTDSATGYVSAEIFENNGGAVGERVEIQAIKSSSDTTRYNVPTISFDGLNADQDYYLRIYAIKGSNYRLDGIRVYHAADESDSAVRSAYEAAGEQNAKYVNLRALLLGAVSEDTLGADGNEGAVFYTDSGESYSLTSSEYQANSPKNEVYLKTGERVAFQIVGEYETVAIGLSAPDTKSGGGSVTVTNGSGTKTQSVLNALDQYYIMEPAPDGSVVIENSGSAMISITNVKLSGDYTPPAVVQSAGALRVSKSLMRYAADFSQLPAAEEPEPTPEVTPDVTPEPTSEPNFGDAIRQLISSFVESLFAGISRLFAS